MHPVHILIAALENNMELTHFDQNGNAQMVDVTDKAITVREASAQGMIGVSQACYQRICDGNIEKGDVLGVARIAGIMGAKRTSDLIPLCHILNLSKVTIDFVLLGKEENPGLPQQWKLGNGETEEIPERFYIKAVCTVKCQGKTGVEMEALTGVSTALLTVYDMCKAIDKNMIIKDICLMEKSGGKSGDYKRIL